ncbi:MAG: nitroreductase family protein [bacterium]|nr:nitroreductase family protein [bacterium]
MSFMELAKNRYSERYFDPRPVEQDKIAKILEAGRTAPTACNYQPQRIYVMQSEEALKKVRSIRVSHFNAPLMLLVCYDTDTAWRNPHDRCYDNYCSGEQDATIVAATMMYEAEDLGVHSVWLRGFDSQQIAETFALPKNHIPVMMFAMGYPSDVTKPSPWHFQRKPLEETVIKL